MHIFEGRRCPETAAIDPIYGAGDLHAGRGSMFRPLPRVSNRYSETAIFVPPKKSGVILLSQENHA